MATLRETANLGLVSAASVGEVHDTQVEQHLLGDAELASDPAVSVFAVAVGDTGANSEEEFGLDVEVGLD